MGIQQADSLLKLHVQGALLDIGRQQMVCACSQGAAATCPRVSSRAWTLFVCANSGTLTGTLR